MVMSIFRVNVIIWSSHHMYMFCLHQQQEHNQSQVKDVYISSLRREANGQRSRHYGRKGIPL